MSTFLIFDAGHGGTNQPGGDPGAIGFGYKEANDVLSFTLKVGGKLAAQYDVRIGYTRTSDVFVGLSERAQIANNAGADFFISFHENAASGLGHGFESFAYLSPSASTLQKQKIIHSKVMAFMNPHGVFDRGLKTANYAVLRETSMSALLFENLFIDNAGDNKLQHDANFIEGLANAYVEGIAEAFGLTKKVAAPAPTPVPTTPVQPSGNVIYKVQVGAYGVKANADDMANKLKAAGFSVYNVQENGLYKVQVGAFSIKANADNLLTQIKAKGFDGYVKEYIK